MVSGKYILNRIHITPTFKCNQKCSYCALKGYDGIYPKWNKEISLLDWEIILSGLKEVSEVVISGGEPTLYADFEEIVNYLSPDHLVYINTNFTCPILWDHIHPSKNVFFNISLHRTPGFKEDVFNQNMKKVKEKGFFHRVLELGKTKHIQTIDEYYYECMLSPKIVFLPDGSVHFRHIDAFKYMENSKDGNQST